MSIDVCLAKLEKVRKANHRSDRWYACCPCHEDKHPSLCITIANNRILMHCFACEANGLDVCNELKINPRNLFESD